MANCSDNAYVIKYTDKSKGTITITKSALVTNLIDIALVGKSRLEYGEIFNENLLHLLENFACPQDPNDPNKPDLTVAFGELLLRPVQGQKWYNSTQKRLFVYNGDSWIPLARAGDVAGNSGVAAHGTFIPRPIGSDGYVFPYEECSFSVSPHSYKSVTDSAPLAEVDYMRCYAQPNGQIVMQFRFRGENELREGYANYQIIGIRGESNISGPSVTPYPVPSPSPSATPIIAPSATATRTPTPTPTSTPVAATPQPTPTSTPTPTPSLSVAASPPPTPTTTPTSTSTPTPTATVTSTPMPTPTPTPTPSAATIVNLPSAFTSATHASGFPGEARAGYILYSNGTVWTTSSQTGGEDLGNWLVNGNPADYQVYATYSEGFGNASPVLYGTFDAWVDTTGGASWSFGIEQPGSGGVEWNGTLTVSIRRKSDQVVLDTANISISLQIGPPA